MSDQQAVWCVMPVMGAPDLTEAAISDVLAQTVPVKLLVILQDVDPAFRERIEAIAEQDQRVFVWSHCPPLPSLSATWNRALDMVWEAGGTEAWVINNDTRVHEFTLRFLSMARQQADALFVTAVGVHTESELAFGLLLDNLTASRGGPDFSNFLISKTGHEKYRFDEGFVPAYGEDLDTHRRYMLGGDGDKIFSINLPYLHVGGGSNTLKAMGPEARQKHEARINQSRAYYEQKWGGPVNQERYTKPFDPASAQDGVTTPELQHRQEAGAHV